jgi:ribosome-associated toxin RatA of RatAB toxin-antitoxin module
MTQVSKSALLPYSPKQIFALVEQVERYPEFLPWCKSTQVVERNEHGMRASITMGLAGLSYTFCTQNKHLAPTLIELQLDTPVGVAAQVFLQLQGRWQFDRLGDSGCKVTLHLEYQFASATVGRLIGSIFDQIASTLMDRFVQRADQLYGG